MLDELPFANIEILNNILFSFWDETEMYVCKACYGFTKCDIGWVYSANDQTYECEHVTYLQRHVLKMRCAICETSHIRLYGRSTYCNDIICYMSRFCH